MASSSETSRMPSLLRSCRLKKDTVRSLSLSILCHRREARKAAHFGRLCFALSSRHVKQNEEYAQASIWCSASDEVSSYLQPCRAGGALTSHMSGDAQLSETPRQH